MALSKDSKLVLSFCARQQKKKINFLFPFSSFFLSFLFFYFLFYFICFFSYLLLSLSPFFSPIATNGPFSNNCLNNKAQPLNQTLGQPISTTYLSLNRPPSMPPANLFMASLDGGGVRKSRVEFLFHFPPPPSKLVIRNHFNNPNLYQITITLSTFKPQ